MQINNTHYTNIVMCFDSLGAIKTLLNHYKDFFFLKKKSQSGLNQVSKQLLHAQEYYHVS